MKWILMLAIVAVAMAGVDAAAEGQTQGLRLPDSLQSLNEVYPGLRVPPPPAPVAAEFCPRPQAPWMRRYPDGFEEAPRSLRATTGWQRLRDFRSRVGVRVLTLWESPGSTISLQAGKRGGPSLQWSSRVMGHGDEASRGLLDALLASTAEGLRRSTPLQGPPLRGSPLPLEHRAQPAARSPDAATR